MFTVYHVGSKLGWSDLFSFTTMKSGTDWSPTFAVFGDMRNDNVEALPYIQEEAQRGQVTAVLHTGTDRYILKTRMPSSRIRTARFSGPFHRDPPRLQRDIPSQRPPFTETPPFHRDPPLFTKNPLHKELPFTETALDKDPPRQIPPWKDHGIRDRDPPSPVKTLPCPKLRLRAVKIKTK